MIQLPSGIHHVANQGDDDDRNDVHPNPSAKHLFHRNVTAGIDHGVWRRRDRHHERTAGSHGYGNRQQQRVHIHFGTYAKDYREQHGYQGDIAHNLCEEQRDQGKAQHQNENGIDFLPGDGIGNQGDDARLFEAQVREDNCAYRYSVQVA